ncbi:uncharacterized protein LOC124499479 isoform X1 [Dermatophagoides farinae]|uniref:uncharacterized protein LOC124499479 isoform X1 n=1 Tax=Dermatophagoides farinae TaxID=6954 RepID=UPI001F107F41|nr:RNA-binding motif, single-stranded-interacting protein 3-like [Dermatophagoides farinae]
MKQESQPKILYSRALQGSMSNTTSSTTSTTNNIKTMSSGNNNNNINQQQSKTTLVVSPSSTTITTTSSILANSMVDMNGPNMSSYHQHSPHLPHLNNNKRHNDSDKVQQIGTSGGSSVVVGIGGNGRTILPNSSQQTNMPFRMSNKNCLQQSSSNNNYSIRHTQPYHNSRISSQQQQQQITSSVSPSTTSAVSAAAAAAVGTGNQMVQTNNKLSTNGSSTSINVPSINSGNNANNNSTTSGNNNNNSSLSMNSTTNVNTQNGTTASILSSDKSDSSTLTTISKTNLYIRGLTPNTTDKDLQLLCQPYGNIVSTKAILDKETNKCKGYGFVDFDNPNSAEQAVKSLISQGVQAQMAKCTDTNRNKTMQQKILQQEHDPTNLYIANLPMTMAETDLEAMLSLYGNVISTRILKDSNGTPRGVGFARMESKEKCESIINILNGKLLPGGKDTLLVKFADGGSKKKNHYKNESRYRSDVDQLQMGFDSTNLTTNGGVTAMLPSPLSATSYQRFSSPYQNPMQANPWMHHQAPQPQYIMQPQLMDPNAATALQFSPALMHQLTAQMSHIQLGGVSGTAGVCKSFFIYIFIYQFVSFSLSQYHLPGNPHPYGTQLYTPQLIPTMPMSGVSGDQQDPINPSQSVSSGSVSGEDPQQHQQQSNPQQTSQQAPPPPNFQLCYGQQK